MQIPEFTDKQHNALQKIVCWVRDESEYADRKISELHLENRLVNRGLATKPKWVSLQKAWDRSMRSPTRRADKAYLKHENPQEEMENLERRLVEEFDCVAFCKLDEGLTSAVTVLAKTKADNFLAIRLGESVMQHNENPHRKKGHERSLAPHLLPLIGQVDINGFLEAQVMKFVSCTDFLPNKNALNAFFSKLYADTCFAPDRQIESDYAVSDSVLVIVDPGHIPYKREYYRMDPRDQKNEVERSLNLIMQRLQEWEIPQELVPMVLNANNDCYVHKLDHTTFEIL